MTNADRIRYAAPPMLRLPWLSFQTDRRFLASSSVSYFLPCAAIQLSKSGLAAARFISASPPIDEAEAASEAAARTSVRRARV